MKYISFKLFIRHYSKIRKIWTTGFFSSKNTEEPLMKPFERLIKVRISSKPANFTNDLRPDLILDSFQTPNDQFGIIYYLYRTNLFRYNWGHLL
jgi:hypothetical protein